MKKQFTKIGMIAIVITTITSCVKDNPIVEVPGNYENGYFITNEGNFGSGNGSISFVSKDGTVENNVFSSINSIPLGDVAQSMTIIGDNAYILVNGSSKIEVTTIDSMISVGTIEGITSPRYMIEVGPYQNKAYVSDWGVNGVQVIDLNTYEITSTISVGNGPEGIVIANGFAYVCNVGGWGLDNTVSIIDTESDLVVSTLQVGDKPSSAVVDANGDIWVLSGGYTEYDADWNVVSETAGTLVRISNNEIANTFTFEVGNHPEDLVINEEGNTLYFSDGSWSKAVYSINITDLELPSFPLINRSFYGLAASNGYIYGTDAVDYVQNGWSFRYSESGNVIDSIQVGIIPSGYCFN